MRFDEFALESYFRQRPGHGGNPDISLEQRLWGLRGNSRLPVSGGRAQFEYSVWMPPGSGQDALAEPENQLFRLRLDNRTGRFDYGAKVFSVGEAFLANPIARERVYAAGLPGVGQGTELWVSAPVPMLGLKPTFSRLDKSDGNARTVSNALRVSRNHQIGRQSRLSYLLESSAATIEVQDAGTITDRLSQTARVDWNSANWSMFLRGTNIGAHPANGQTRMTSIWELGTGLQVPGNFDTVNLNVLLHHDQSRRVGDDIIQGTTFANLTLRTPLPLPVWERTPPGWTMTTSLGYRWSSGLPAAANEGVSVQVSLNLQGLR